MTQGLAGERILLGVSGGIAAYKAAELVRRLREAGAEVRVVLTEAAEHFVGAATFQALSGNPVRGSLWDPSAEAAMGHIELARWATRVVVAPASADVIARLAHGTRERSAEHDVPGDDGTAGARAGDEQPHVAASGDASEHRPAARARRTGDRARRRATGLWGVRTGPHERTPGDRRCAGCRAVAIEGWPAGGSARADQRRTYLRGSRPGALPRQSQLRQDGLRARRGSRRTRSRRDPCRWPGLVANPRWSAPHRCAQRYRDARCRCGRPAPGHLHRRGRGSRLHASAHRTAQDQETHRFGRFGTDPRTDGAHPTSSPRSPPIRSARGW